MKRKVIGQGMQALFACCFLGCLCTQGAHGDDGVWSSEVGRILEDLADCYLAKAPDSLSLVIQMDIDPELESWQVRIEPGPRVTVQEGTDDQAAFVLTMSIETLRRMRDGTMTALTAGGKASGPDAAPLEVRPTEVAASIPNVREAILSFLQHFFNPTVPERTLLAEEHSRVVHGANVIVLYYSPGFRSAWYMVKKGQRLNEPGDTNPYPQAFVIISGRGEAKIGDETVRIGPGESYYIPPGSDHVVWTDDDEPVVLIWMAWGEGA